MKYSRILQIGAGRSASAMISYLAQSSLENNWTYTIIDSNESMLQEVKLHHPNIETGLLNSKKNDGWAKYIANHDVVISMLPAFMHPQVAKYCLVHNKHLFTASYVSPEMRQMQKDVEQKGLLFLNECGLDPGLDHMSAMKIIDELKQKGAKITAFESFCGGLVAPESDNNPWNYKFSWNPRNVVLAGQGMSTFIHGGHYKIIPYHRLFERTDHFEIPGYGHFEGYANRDSLLYQSLYQLEGIDTLYRGTLRRPGYCSAWNFFVQLGLTDDTFQLNPSMVTTRRQFIQQFLPETYMENWHEYVQMLLPQTNWLDLKEKLDFIKIFDDIPLGFSEPFTAAQALQSILEQHWVLGNQDRDLVVMIHLIDYQLNGVKNQIKSYLVHEGEDPINTAMAKTVGLPLAIAVKLFVLGEANASGVQIPVSPQWYLPILKEMERLGVGFKEEYYSW